MCEGLGRLIARNHKDGADEMVNRFSIGKPVAAARTVGTVTGRCACDPDQGRFAGAQSRRSRGWLRRRRGLP